MARKYRQIDPRIWDDEHGISHFIGESSAWKPDRIRWQQNVRRFVFLRDDFTCQRCGARALKVPENYDGRYSSQLTVNRLTSSGMPVCLTIDHIKPQSVVADHHPRNLECVCKICNCEKGIKDGI